MCVLIVGKIASSANKEYIIFETPGPDNWLQKIARSHGVMVSTLDSESSDPSSVRISVRPLTFSLHSEKCVV